MQATVLARNTQPGPTVFSLGVNNDAVIEWKGAGDPMGEDVQPVPPTFLDNIMFKRAVTRGIIVIEEAPEEVERVFAQHKAEWDQRQAKQAAAAQATIDQAPQNDVLMLGCVAPNANGTTCGTQVPVRSVMRNEAPPLCGLHRDLAPKFISEVTDKIVDGKPEVNWVLPRLGEPI